MFDSSQRALGIPTDNVLNSAHCSIFTPFITQSVESNTILIGSAEELLKKTSFKACNKRLPIFYTVFLTKKMKSCLSHALKEVFKGCLNIAGVDSRLP